MTTNLKYLTLTMLIVAAMIGCKPKDDDPIAPAPPANEEEVITTMILSFNGQAGAADKELRFNETTKHWDTGPIDWEEFWRVVKGEGPCNRQRLSSRRKAHDDGAWVREAAMAHAEKRRARAKAA